MRFPRASWRIILPLLALAAVVVRDVVGIEAHCAAVRAAVVRRPLVIPYHARLDDEFAFAISVAVLALPRHAVALAAPAIGVLDDALHARIVQVVPVLRNQFHRKIVLNGCHGVSSRGVVECLVSVAVVFAMESSQVE